MNRSTPSQDAPLHEVITFYSYKGGTGRTMALANAACLLSTGKDCSQRVLAIDWDLEAPGLQYYLRPPGRESKEMTALGVVEYFTRVQAFLNEKKLDPAKDQDENAHRVLNEIPWASFCHTTRFANIDFMPAGRTDTSYQSRLAKLDWHQIYQLSPGLFRCFARQLVTVYDVVLIDSRTGMNDSSGICTSLMPDKLVVVFTPNRQSLAGIENLVNTSVKYRQASRDLRPLMVYPLPSRIDAERDELRQLWRHGDSTRVVEGYQPQFERIFQDAYSLEACELSTYCNEVQVQHSPDYSYGEDVAAIHANEGDRFSIVRSYQALLRWIQSSAAPWETPEIVQARHRLEMLLKEEADAMKDKSGINWSRMAIMQSEMLELVSEQRGVLHQETISIRERLIESLLRGGESISALQLLMELAKTLPELRTPVRVQSISTILETVAALRAKPGQDSTVVQLKQAVIKAAIDSLYIGKVLPDPTSMMVLEALGNTLRDTAPTEALALQQALAEIQTMLHGEEDPSTLTALANLATTLKALGDASKARMFEEEIFKVRLLKLGEGHPDTLEAMGSLAATLGTLGDLIKAREMQEKVLQLRLDLLGDDHPDTLNAMSSLAKTLRSIGDLSSARSLQEKVLDVYRRLFGEDHSNSISAAASLSAILKEQGDLLGAQALQKVQGISITPSNNPVFQGVTASGDLVLGDKVLGDNISGEKIGGDKLIINTSAKSEHIPAYIGSPPTPRQIKQGPWRVFLSHTSELRMYPDGGSYIDLAERAVSAEGHAIVDMADFSVSDAAPATVCQQRVRECDVLLGIYGLRYGSPVRDQPEVSYTELEFLTATDAGLPRLIFVMDADSEELGLPPRALIDPDYGDRQGAFMQRVKDSGLILQVFRNPEDLKAQVVRSLRQLSASTQSSA